MYLAAPDLLPGERYRSYTAWIQEVDPKEAQLLIGLIEMLIKDWYMVRHERQKHLEGIISAASGKKEAKQKAAAVTMKNSAWISFVT